jgi:prepilin-type N-terminal cleavage/methylation domain-containing protein
MSLSKRPISCRRGFTLVELLVVIAIIGILIALLLPAVQAAREAARRTHCVNNLKQIALAANNYELVNQTLPPGGVLVVSDNANFYGANWAIAILPFMELQNLYDQYDQRYDNAAPENEVVRTTLVGAFMCPSEPNHQELALRETGPLHHVNRWAPGSYAAVTGRALTSAWWGNHSNGTLPMKSRGAMHTVGNPGPSGDPNRTLRTERIANVKDGMSNTMLVGERSIVSPHPRRTAWAYTYGQYSNSAAYTQTRTLLIDYDRCATVGGPGGDNPCKRGFSSFHPDGMHFAFGDGSVHFFSTSLDMNTFVAMATIDGGEPVIQAP